MYNLLEQHPYYVVLAVNLLIWIGILGYVFSLKKGLNSLLKTK
jgi:CcmD family protein